MLRILDAVSGRGQAMHLARGRQAERLAERHLKKHGLRLVRRNFHCAGGEIDLVMADDDTVVFVEVRMRARSDFGSAAESVNFSKQRRVRFAAAAFLKRNRLSDAPCRIDVVTIDGTPPWCRLRWIKNAF